ncbi:MAG: phage major capsid protein [Oscillospiraceae bacterium]|nr:phage major capsid protein [Oscillospiraceae bacterium]
MAQFESIKLEKSMYNIAGKTFTEVLEHLDPSKSYDNSDVAGLDAFQRQLKRYDIKVSGSGSDMVEKFFTTSESAALFPEYVVRAVRQGMDEANALNEIVATKTVINGLDYRSITSVSSQDEKELKDVCEGAVIPTTKITLQENFVKLKKRGRMLVATYEAIRFQRLDLFTVTLKQIGAYIAKSQLSDAINVLLNGDGNIGAAEEISVQTSGTITYSDILKLWNTFTDYELNTLIAAPDVMTKLLNLTEFKDAAAGLNFHGTGKLVTPLGAVLIKSNCVPSGKIIGLDKRCALEMVSAGDVMIEHDKLIDRQLERSAITSITGFAKIFGDAAKVLKI